MKKLILFLTVLITSLTSKGQTGLTCAEAIDLEGINNGAILYFESPINVRWFKFTADSSIQAISVQGERGSGTAQLDKIEIFGGTCSALTLDSIYSFAAADSQLIAKKLPYFIKNNEYFIKVSYVTNSYSSVSLMVVINDLTQSGVGPNPLCQPNGCTLFSEQFNYSAAICAAVCGTLCVAGTCASLATSAGFTNPFLNNATTNSTIPCWGAAYNTPQIMNDEAYMWTQQMIPCPGPGGNTQFSSEAIFRTTPNLSNSSLYVLQYDYRTGTNGLTDLWVGLESANYWPTTILGNFPAVPYPQNMSAVDHQMSLTNTTFLTRRACFQPTGNGAFDLYFMPTNMSCTREHLYIDNVSLFEIISAPVATSYTICSGQSTTLSNSCVLPTGLVSYSWAPATGLSCTTCASPVATPTTTTQYTLTVNVINGSGSCSAVSGVVTINVNAASVSASANTNNGCLTGSTTCAGQSAILTANSGMSGTVTYTWNPGALNGASVVVSPTTTTVYTVTANNGTCSATATTTVTITNCNCTGTALPLTGTPVPGTYSLNASSTLTGSLTLGTGVNVNVAAGVTLTVPAGITLTINGAHLSACYGMWQGIRVNSGGTVSVLGRALIEDAIVAIDNGGSATNIITGLPSNIQVNGAVFNCNRTAIRTAYYQNSNNTYYSTTYFKLENATITCRCSIPVLTNPVTLNTFVTPGSGSLNDEYAIDNAYPTATLKSPYQGKVAYQGVYFENNGLVNTQTPSTHFLYTIGNPSTANNVVFDNLNYGIFAYNTNVKVQNNGFEFLVGSRSTPATAIFVKNTNKDWYNGIYVSSSKFLEVVTDISAVNYFEHNINNNLFFSRQSIIVPSDGGAQTLRGYQAVYAKTSRWGLAEFNSNTFRNINNGINFIVDANTGYNGGNGQYINEVKVNNNSFDKQFTGNNFPLSFIGNAIVIDNVLANPSTGPASGSGNGSQIQIQNNSVKNTFRGILARNHKYQKVRTHSNSVTLLSEGVLGSGAPSTQYGIKHDNCLNLNAPTSYGHSIFENNVTGFTTTAFNDTKKGIWVSSCGNQYVTCNTVNNTGRAMEFTGTNPFTFWQKNVMQNNGNYYVLSSTGIIGQQGTAANGQDNRWIGSSAATPSTVADNSNATSSDLYIFSGTANGTPLWHSNPNFGTIYNGASLLTASAASAYACSTPPLRLAANSFGKEKPVKVNLNGKLIQTAIDSTDLLSNIVADNIDYGAQATESRYMAQSQAYQLIEQNDSLRNSNSVFAAFYTNNKAANRGLIGLIEDSLRSGNLGYVSGLLSSFNPENSLESNYQRFYEIYINAHNLTATAQDSMDLENLAASCPALNGTVVYQARAFYNSWMNGFRHFEDNCPENEGEVQNESSSKKAETAIPLANVELNVYPNPNTGTLYLSTTDNTMNTVQVEVYDLTGKKLSQRSITMANGIGQMDMNFSNGIYFINLINTKNNESKKVKVIINK